MHHFPFHYRKEVPLQCKSCAELHTLQSMNYRTVTLTRDLTKLVATLSKISNQTQVAFSHSSQNGLHFPPGGGGHMLRAQQKF